MEWHTATSIGEHEFVEDGGEGVRQKVGEGCYGCIGSPRGLTAPDRQSGEAAAKITSSVRGNYMVVLNVSFEVVHRDKNDIRDVGAKPQITPELNSNNIPLEDRTRTQELPCSLCEADDEWHGGRRSKEVGRVEASPNSQSERKVGEEFVSKDIAEVGTRRRIECDDACRSCGRKLYSRQCSCRQSSFGLLETDRKVRGQQWRKSERKMLTRMTPFHWRYTSKQAMKEPVICESI